VRKRGHLFLNEEERKPEVILKVAKSYSERKRWP
jgi:hypothetical protein